MTKKIIKTLNGFAQAETVVLQSRKKYSPRRLVDN